MTGAMVLVWRMASLQHGACLSFVSRIGQPTTCASVTHRVFLCGRRVAFAQREDASKSPWKEGSEATPFSIQSDGMACWGAHLCLSCGILLSLRWRLRCSRRAAHVDDSGLATTDSSVAIENAHSQLVIQYQVCRLSTRSGRVIVIPRVSTRASLVDAGEERNAIHPTPPSGSRCASESRVDRRGARGLQPAACSLQPAVKTVVRAATVKPPIPSRERRTCWGE